MIHLDNVHLYITKCERKVDRQGYTFLRCKGFTKGTTGEQERKMIEFIGKDHNKKINGANFLTNISIYGEPEQLDILENKFRTTIDEILKSNEEAQMLTKEEQKKQKKFIKPKFLKFYPKGVMFLRTYLMTGILSTCIYVFNYEYTDRKPHGPVPKSLYTLTGELPKPKKTTTKKKTEPKKKKGARVGELADGVKTSKVITTTHSDRFESVQSEKRKQKAEQKKLKEIEKQTKTKKIELPKSDFISELDMLDKLVQEAQNNAEIEVLDIEGENNSTE